MSSKSGTDSPRLLAEGKFLRFLDADGWEYTQRKNISGIVGMMAYTDDGKVVLIEQYRPPTGSTVIEIPAGLVGDEPDRRSEAMAEAAGRELLEETGYRAGRIEEVVAEATVSAGTTGETMTLYRCTELEKIDHGGGDDSEDIRVHLVELDSAETWLETMRRQGHKIDVKVYLAIWLARGPR
ncbi:MAG: NUDIX hydrolase [Planctomycetota bacterium]